MFKKWLTKMVTKLGEFLSSYSDFELIPNYLSLTNNVLTHILTFVVVCAIFM